MVVRVLLLVTVAATLLDCGADLGQMLSHSLTLFPSEDYGAMMLYSGKWVNDLGDYHSCQKVEKAEYVLIALLWQGPFIGLGLCGPKTCSREDYYHIIQNFTSILSPETALFHFSSYAQILTSESIEIPVGIEFPKEKEPQDLSSGAIVMVVMCVVVVALVGAGTAMDLLHSSDKPVRSDPGAYELTSYHDKPTLPTPSQVPLLPVPRLSHTKLSRFIRCFSLLSTFPKLFLSDKDQGSSLLSLNGLRTISMVWIVAGHVLLVRFTASTSRNPYDIVDYVKESQTVWFYGARYAVDTFFWLSGFFLGVALLPRLNNAHISTWKLYLFRALRLLPAYIFVLFLTWTLSVYIASAPRGYQVETANTYCSDYWWTHLLFLNNLIPSWLGIGCLGQSWYIAADMQMYIISVPLLISYVHRDQRWGWVGFCVLTGISILSSAWLTWEYGFTALVASDENKDQNFTSRYYVQAYTRFAPYALGVLCALVYHAHTVYQVSGQIADLKALALAAYFSRRIVRIVSLVLSIFGVVSLLYLEYLSYQALNEPDLNWSPEANIAYISLNRCIWGLCLSGIWLPIALGRDVGVGWVLSWPIWTPLARLSYCVYLTHAHIIAIGTLSQQSSQWFGGLSLLTDSCFYAVLSYLVAVPLYLCIELPANELVRLIGLR